MTKNKSAPAGLHTGTGRGCCQVETAGTPNVAPAQTSRHIPQDVAARLRLALLRRQHGLGEPQARTVASLIWEASR